MPVDVESSGLPLVVVAFQGDIKKEEATAYIAKLDQLFATGQKLGVMVTTTGMGHVDRRVVEQHAEWFKRNKALFGERWIGMGVVISSATARFLMSSLLLVTRLPMPYKVCDTEDQARTWLAERFQEQHIPVPAALKRIA